MNTTLLVTILILFSAVAAALHALLTKRDSKSAFGWIAFSLFLPVFGPAIYLLFGINRLNDKAHKAYFATLDVDSSHSIPEPEATDLRPLSRVGESVTGKGLRSCNSVSMLENAEAFFPTIIADMRSATRKIYLSSYLIDNDATGNELAEVLREAQDRGVDVRIIIDSLGEFMTLPRIGHKFNKLGLNFVRFNPIRLFPPSLHLNMRNHRKIIIIDGKTAYTGGQNIGNRHFVNNANNRHPVVDLHFQFTGKTVDELERAFLRDWYYCRQHKDDVPFSPENENLSKAPIWTRIVLDGPNEYFDKLNDLLVGIISAAKIRVLIMTPYFLPDPDIIAALVGARLRGVEVKVVLPEKNNIFMVHWAMQNILAYFLEKDIDVFFQPAPFVHTKLLLIDDGYSLIGSANMDARSLRLNFELVVEVFDRGLNSQLSSYFHSSLAKARKVSTEQLKAIPFLTRVRNAAAWLFSPYL